MTDYRDSLAYRRSNRTRPDGSPVWPLTPADLPKSLPAAHSRVAEREAARKMERRAVAAGRVA